MQSCARTPAALTQGVWAAAPPPRSRESKRGGRNYFGWQQQLLLHAAERIHAAADRGWAAALWPWRCRARSTHTATGCRASALTAAAAAAASAAATIAAVAAAAGVRHNQRRAMWRTHASTCRLGGETDAAAFGSHADARCSRGHRRGRPVPWPRRCAIAAAHVGVCRSCCLPREWTTPPRPSLCRVRRHPGPLPARPTLARTWPCTSPCCRSSVARCEGPIRRSSARRST